MYAQEIPLSGSELDRNALARTRENLLQDLLANPRTRIIAVYDRTIAVSDPGELRWFTRGDFPDDLAAHSEALWVYVGRVAGEDVVALVLPTTVGGFDSAPWRAQHTWLGLRELADFADTAAASIAVPVVALANWHVTSQFCGRCGGRTHAQQAGWTRHCEQCGVDHFPRTDSAVIMAIIDNSDRILLGSSVKWPQERYSTLAGFVESGESLEGAVRREAFEESGVHIGAVRYWGSQPWPFPASLMLGYFARATSTDITVDEQEIRSARWFTRDELVALVGSGAVTLPGKVSIARALIDTWLAGDQPDV